jgi:acyl-coenzyme A thioesterase PaaI-like protein
MKQPDLTHCFGCGKENPKGLHLTKRTEGNKTVIEFSIDKNHCGFPGILHGGITFTVLDEVMCYTVVALDMVAVTLSVKIDYVSPGRVGHKLRVEGWIEKIDGKYIECASEAKDIDTGKCVARAHGSYKSVDLDRFAA